MDFDDQSEHQCYFAKTGKEILKNFPSLTSPGIECVLLARDVPGEPAEYLFPTGCVIVAHLFASRESNVLQGNARASGCWSDLEAHSTLVIVVPAWNPRVLEHAWRIDRDVFAAYS